MERPPASLLRKQAAALDGQVLDPTVRAFVLALANDGIDSDIDWIQTIATVVAKKAPAEWTDDDRDRFRQELAQQVASFQRPRPLSTLTAALPELAQTPCG